MVEIKNLTKVYGNHRAVDDLTITVEEGLIYGFLGPNGAGKSTTMNIITGCLAATEGEVTIGGYDIYEDPVEAKSCIGYLPELPPPAPATWGSPPTASAAGSPGAARCVQDSSCQ